MKLSLLLVALATSASADYLTVREIARVRRFMPTYEWAADKVGVPLAALPTLHYLESELRCARGADDEWQTRNMGGPFMMDMGGDGTDEFDSRIRREEHRVAKKYGISPPPRVRDHFEFAALCAADELRGKARDRLWRRGVVDMDVLADAFWGYNGRAYGSWRKAPYVYNHPRRGRAFLMRVNVKGTTSEWVCSRPGAMIVYAEIERRIIQCWK